MGPFCSFSQFVKYRLSLPEGADVAENIFQDRQGIGSILANPAGIVGIGSNGHDLTAQLFEPLQIVPRSTPLVLISIPFPLATRIFIISSVISWKSINCTGSRVGLWTDLHT